MESRKSTRSADDRRSEDLSSARYVISGGAPRRTKPRDRFYIVFILPPVDRRSAGEPIGELVRRGQVAHDADAEVAPSICRGKRRARRRPSSVAGHRAQRCGAPPIGPVADVDVLIVEVAECAAAASPAGVARALEESHAELRSEIHPSRFSGEVKLAEVGARVEVAALAPVRNGRGDGVFDDPPLEGDDSDGEQDDGGQSDSS
jgi:hypothetical protein